MSNHQTDELTRALRERSDDMSGTHVAFEDVKGRARGIRRRRRTVGGLAAAAVLLAVGVPVGIGATGGLDRGQELMPVDQGPSVTETPTPEPAPTPGPDGTFRLTLDGLEVGAAPTAPYVLVDQRELVTPDRTVDLPDGLVQVTPFRGGWLAIAERRTGAGGMELRFMDQDFRVSRTVDTGPTFAVSDDRSRVTYTEREGDTTWLVVASTTTDEETRHELTGTGDLQPVGFVGDEDVVFQTTAGERQDPAVATPGESSPISGILNVRGTSEATGLVSGLTQWSPTGSCSAVADPMTGEQAWETCDWLLDAFSPDGRYVVGYPTYYDGPGPSSMAILDAATGDVVTRFNPGRIRQVTGVSQAVWEDDDSVLVMLTQGNKMGMVRADVDGRLETVTDTLPVTDMTIGMWFAEHERF